MNEIDEVRCQRDEAKVENMRLRAEVERQATLLRYAEEAIMEEYRLRFGIQVGKKHG
jgi:hypothetical protein